MSNEKRAYDIILDIVKTGNVEEYVASNSVPKITFVGNGLKVEINYYHSSIGLSSMYVTPILGKYDRYNSKRHEKRQISFTEMGNRIIAKAAEKRMDEEVNFFIKDNINDLFGEHST